MQQVWICFVKIVRLVSTLEIPALPAVTAVPSVVPEKRVTLPVQVAVLFVSNAFQGNRPLRDHPNVLSVRLESTKPTQTKPRVCLVSLVNLRTM